MRRSIPIVLVTALFVTLAAIPALQAQEASVGLGTADDFAVLAGETITNTGPTTINGDVGLHPGSAVTGFDSVTQDGELHVTDAVAEQAKVDLVTAYNDAAARGPATTVPTELGGQVLPGGVYSSESGTFEITGTLTLDAEGDPNAVFIFQMSSTLVAAAASSVNLINGAEACNVFWQVGSSATLGTTSALSGSILASESITLNTGATLQGRALAQTGAVTLDSNTINQPACSVPATTTTTVADDTTTTAADDTTTTAADDTTTTAADDTTTTAADDTTTTTAPGETTTTVAPPEGGVDTGGGSTSGPNVALLLGGVSLVALAGGAFAVRQRSHERRSA